MYQYNYSYNIPQMRGNMYRVNNNDQRLIGGGFFAPFLLGGLAGYAIGNRPNYYYSQPFYNPYPNYYNNNYYYNPYYY